MLAFASTLRSRLCLRCAISPLDQTQSLPPRNLASRLTPIASATRSRLCLYCASTPLDQTQLPLSLPSSLNLTRFDEFFFLGFVSFVFLYWLDLMNFFSRFCFFVFLYWGMILYICLAAEKMWVISRKCVFFGIFKNTTKYHKIFFKTFFEMQPNTWKYFPFPKITFPVPENILYEPNTALVSRCLLR